MKHEACWLGFTQILTYSMTFINRDIVAVDLIETTFPTNFY